MCGIVGFRSKKDFNKLRESLPLAVTTLTHRGPDDSGLFFDPKAGVGLGHRRLSTIIYVVPSHVGDVAGEMA